MFDFLEMHTKTGIMSRRLLPDHAVVDPRTLATLPKTALTSTALDALCHALEAYSCRPATSRAKPVEPGLRPMTQGANIWSDEIAGIAIRAIAENFDEAVCREASEEALDRLMWASTLAGISFGNAGCHLPHAMSYPVSGMVREYRPRDYPPGAPLVPHGLSVVLEAPAVYRLTGRAAPERHRRLAEWLGAALGPSGDPGEAVADWLLERMKLAGLPLGLAEIGYEVSDIPAMVEGALPQRRLLDNSPLDIDGPRLEALYRDAMFYD